MYPARYEGTGKQTIATDRISVVMPLKLSTSFLPFVWFLYDIYMTLYGFYMFKKQLTWIQKCTSLTEIRPSRLHFMKI